MQLFDSFGRVKNALAKIAILFFLLILGVAVEGSAEQLPELPVRLELEGEAQVLIGKPISASIDLSFSNTPARFRLVSPIEKGTSVLIQKGWILGKEQETTKTKLNFQLIPIAPLQYSQAVPQFIPSMNLVDEGEKVVAKTAPIEVSFDVSLGEVKLDQEKPGDLYPPLSLGIPAWIVILAILILLVGLFFGVRSLVRWSKRRKVQSSPDQVVRSDYDQALFDLSEIEKNAYWKTGEHKKLYFGVSRILKKFIGARYRIEADDLTSDEMMKKIREKEFDKSLVLDLEGFFKRLDVIKFTDEVPPTTEASQLVVESRKILRSMRG